MPIYTTDENLDLTNFTLRTLNKNKISIMSLPYQNMPMWNLLFNGGNIKKQYSSHGYEERTDVKESNSAKHVGNYDEDVVARESTSSKITVPWVNSQTYMITNDREIAENSGSETRIIEYFKYLDMKQWQSLAILLEKAVWGKPTTSADTKTPYGFEYWFPRNASAGFNGGNPDGFSDVAGVDSEATGNEYWNNYTGTYSAFTRAALTTVLQTVHSKIQWELPVGVPNYEQGTPQFKMYMNWATYNSIVGMAAEQNDTVGKDIDPFWKTAGFRGIGFTPVAYLDSDTTNPIYFLDMSTIHIGTLASMWLKRYPAMRDPKCHRNIISYIDCVWNIICNNRRRNAIIYQA